MVDLYTRLAFSDKDVGRTWARFFGRSFHRFEYAEWGDSDFIYEAPEGKLTLVFSKWAGDAQ